MKKTVQTIINLLEDEYEIQGNGNDNYVTNVNSTGNADTDSLVWISPTRIDKEQILATTKSKVIIGDHSLSLRGSDLENKILIRVKNPKLVFIKIVNELFVDVPSFEIDPSAVIHPEATIANNVHIGPLSYIGKVNIKEGTIIHGNVHIKDNVSIGENVIIQAGCVIGGTGLNFTKDEEGAYHDFPHIGGVIIEDNVEIQACNVIDRGVLSDTIIGSKTKIDSFCYIAHNCIIGKENIIIGKTMISGSVKTGDNCWFGPSSIIRDQLSIGDNCFVGMGSVVTSNLDHNSKVMGNPARPVDDMKKLLKKFKTYIVDEN
jgi:UDP-3-O-[3-hydroxymyristoyl] glucosamine N-acyltransferase